MWTHFRDMHSGGDCKEKPYENIYIEALENEAIVIFYNRFKHNPHRITCTCCGEDYSISSHESLTQLTGYHRNCRCLETPRLPDGKYDNDNPIIREHYYLEDDEEIPQGFKVYDAIPRYGKYQTLEDYLKNNNILVIYKDQIKDEERVGDVPTQGYIWVE